ncbi:MAG TPA: hypothetical protein VM533_16120 [Fimbriiglobus sp.]|jgi:hypothetical protein|nr:hypothetical protein [Fimbriiglobus sp.]
MSTAHVEYPPAFALCKRWVATYTEFVSLVNTVRSGTLRGESLGLLPDLVRDRAAQLTDLADHLTALGYRPHERFAGAESKLWSETLKLAGTQMLHTPPADAPLGQVAAGVERMRDAWKRFAGFVAELPEDFLGHLPVLNPQYLYSLEGILWLMGTRRQPTPDGVRPDLIV